MATDEQIQKVMNRLGDLPGCPSCGVRVRFGDLECPRCGEDLYDDLCAWAERLIDDICGDAARRDSPDYSAGDMAVR